MQIHLYRHPVTGCYAGCVERINLNVPSEIRARLRKVATRLDLTEAETARRLLVAALERTERQQIYDKVGAAQTPELRERQLRMVAAFERDDG